MDGRESTVRRKLREIDLDKILEELEQSGSASERGRGFALTEGQRQFLDNRQYNPHNLRCTFAARWAQDMVKPGVEDGAE